MQIIINNKVLADTVEKCLIDNFDLNQSYTLQNIVDKVIAKKLTSKKIDTLVKTAISRKITESYIRELSSDYSKADFNSKIENLFFRSLEQSKLLDKLILKKVKQNIKMLIGGAL